MDEHDSRARAYLGAYRHHATPDARARTEAWRALDVAIAREAEAGAPPSVRRLFVVPIVVVVALAAALVLVTIVQPSLLALYDDGAPSSAPYSRPAEAPRDVAEPAFGPPSAKPTVPAPKQEAAPADEPPDQPGAELEPPHPEAAADKRPVRDRPDKRGGAPPDDAGSLADELALLGPAQAALRSGQPAPALRLFERHAARFPDSALAEERAAGRVLAVCALGRADAAAVRKSFERRYPDSPLRARLMGACADAE